MLSSIEKCPPEVIEHVIRHLPLPDIRNLRLGSRQLAVLATQDTFKSYFVNITVRITKADLDTFIELTKPGGLGCLVENLVLTGVAIDITLLQDTLRDGAKWVTEFSDSIHLSTQHKCTPQELAKTEEDLIILQTRIKDFTVLTRTGVYHCLLKKALRNVAAHGKLRKLRSLKLDVVVLCEDATTETPPDDGGDWKIIWVSTAIRTTIARSQEAASNCFDIAMTSLADSKLRVNKLDAFNSTLRCSLGLDKINDIKTPEVDLADPFYHLTSLSLSVSDRVLSASELEGTAEELDALRMQQNTFEGLGRLVSASPRLEALHLHWFKTLQLRGGSDEGDDIYSSRARDFGTLAKAARIPWLKMLALRGLYVTEQSLLRVLRGAPIQDFSMEEVQMRDGTFRPIFDYCTSSEASMQRLFFDDIWENQIVMFEGGGPQKFPYARRFSGGPTLERTGKEVRRSIQYGFPTGRTRGSPQAYEWYVQRERNYGPP